MTMPVPHPLVDQLAEVHPTQRFRKVDPAVAALETALSRLVEPLALSVTGETVRVGLAGEAPVDAIDPWLTLTLGGKAAAVRIPWSLASRIAGQTVEGGDAGDAALVIEDALAPWLDSAEDALGVTIRLAALSDTAPEDGLPIARALVIDGAGTGALTVALRLSTGAADLLGCVLSARPLRRYDPTDLHLPIRLVVGRTRLTRSELASLAPGDALLLPEGAGPPIALVAGHLTAAVEPCAAGVRMTAPFQHLPQPDSEAPPMPTDQDAPGATTEAPRRTQAQVSPPLIDDIEVQLTFLAGQALVSLRDLRSMAPGTVVPLPLPADASVRIVVNGRNVGTGELIDVGGRRAVQIRSLFADE